MHEFIMRAFAAARRWKVLALDARNFKSACTVTLLDNFVNARDLNRLARLVNICHIASRCVKQRGSKLYAEVRLAASRQMPRRALPAKGAFDTPQAAVV
jgi:hypothetical protein